MDGQTLRRGVASMLERGDRRGARGACIAFIAERPADLAG